jgi:hypothetical protein
LVHRIGKMLCFQTKTMILFKENATSPSIMIEKMSRIELHILSCKVFLSMIPKGVNYLKNTSLKL